MSAANMNERQSLRRRIDKKLLSLADLSIYTKAQLTAHKEMLIEMMSSVQELDNKILAKQRTDQNLNNDMEDLEDECDAITLNIKVMISEIHIHISSNAGNADGNQSRCSIDLPKLQLPEYFADGNKDVLTCRAFFDNFEHLINKYNLNELEKFNLLDRQCHGRAKAMISSLPVVSQTYSKAKDILVKAFSEEMPQKFSVVREFTELSFAWGIDDPFLFYAKIRKMSDSLKQLEIDRDLFMLYFIWNALPVRFQDILVAITNKSHPNLKEVFDKFLEAANRYQSKISLPSNNISSCATTLKTEKIDTVVKCQLCDDRHNISKCHVYVDVEQKVNRLKELGLCLKCFKQGHFSKHCNFRTTGLCVKCKKANHWSFLCNFNNNNNSPNPSNNNIIVTSSSLTGEVMMSDCMLPVLSIDHNIMGCNSRRVSTMLDSGSQCSFIVSSLADELNLKVIDPFIKLKIRGINSTQKCTTKVVEFPVIIGDYSYNISCLCLPSINVKFRISKLTELTGYLRKNGVVLAYDCFNNDNSPTEVSNIEFLLGARDWSAVARLDAGVVGVDGNFTNYFKTNDGYVLVGSIDKWLSNWKYLSTNNSKYSFDSNEISCNSCLTEIEDIITPDRLVELANDNELELIYNKFMNVEVSHELDVGEEEVKTESELNSFIFDNSFRDHNGMHVMAIPWIARNKELLSKNENLALKVLYSVKKKQSQSDTLKRMDDVFKEQLKAGIIERIDDFESFKHKFPNYSFLSHFPVVKNDRETSKVRIVFMANLSEKQNKTNLSLNQCIHPGFNKTTKIASSLNATRFDSNLLIFDISKAYHRLGMTDENAAHFLFYWFRDVVHNDYEPIILKCNRIVFGMNVSPYLLQCCLYKFLVLENEVEDDKLKELKMRIYKGSYVDNFAVGENNTEVLFDTYEKVNDIFEANGFPLQQFVTNNVSLQDKIDLRFDNKTGNDVKILGMIWNRIDDSFKAPEFKFNVDATTKREIISTLKSAFDLQNVNMPVLNRAKIYLQNLQKDSKLKWDDMLAPAKLNEWRNIARQANMYEPIPLQRCVGSRTSRFILISMCDASKDFIGCVNYLKDMNTNTISFISAHNKILDHNMRMKTMPILELCSVEYAVEKVMDLHQSLCNDIENLNISDIFMFTDSTIALNWINTSENNDKKWQKRKIFVNNRIKNIIELCKQKNPIKIAHIGTKQNAADYVTRVISPKKLVDSYFVSGPEFLKESLDELDYMLIPNPNLDNNPDLPEFTVSRVDTDIEVTDRVIDISRYSSLSKSVRILQKVVMFINNCKKGIQSKTGKKILCDSEKYRDCELKLVKMEQRKQFPELFSYFECGKKKKREMPELITKMNIIKDEQGVLRVKSKMSKLRGKTICKMPILLSQSMDFTKLLILDYHKKFNHCGVYYLLNQLKRRYSILKAYSAVRKVLKECYHCKRFNSRPIKSNANCYRDWNVNPTGRIFSTCFVDCFGPYYVRYGENKVKAYGVLFKCVWSKMINVEVVLSLASNDFIVAFQNHIYSYGIPEYLISDEGSNFTSSFNWLNQCFKSKEVVDFFSERNVMVTKFENYPPGSLNRGIGGIVESGVGIIKKLIQGAIRNNVIDFLSFQAVIRQCVCYANKRPVTQQGSLRSSNEEDCMVITPEYLKFGYSLPILEIDYKTDEWTEDKVSELMSIENLRKVIEAKDRVRKLYSTEFLYGLIDDATKLRGKYLPVNHQKLKPGDIVLIKDSFIKAANYPLAKVLSVEENSIGETVRVVLKKGNKTTVNRDISSLILLVRASEVSEDCEPSRSLPKFIPTDGKKRRKAASKCLMANKELIETGKV